MKRNYIKEINNDKIKYYIDRGYIDVEDDVKFKYIVEILRLFKINVKAWMRGGYILNDNEAIMFTKAQNLDWNDTFDNEYMYELCVSQKDKTIATRNDYWGDRTIYIFRKEINDDYKFMGCFKQDEDKIKKLFSKGIKNQRPYKKIGTKIKLNKFQKNKQAL